MKDELFYERHRDRVVLLKKCMRLESYSWPMRHQLPINV